MARLALLWLCFNYAYVDARRVKRPSFFETGASSSQNEGGSIWGEQLVLDVLTKLNYVFIRPSQAAAQLNEQYECIEKKNGKTVPCKAKISGGRLPDAPKFLRMGFHDCVKYTDGTGGCDGCLNLDGVFTNYVPDKKFPLPDGVAEDGDNNNMALTADVLERIYTDPGFPSSRGMPVLSESLQESGKSRADLWALATLASAHFGMESNNLVCKGSATNIAEAIGRPDLCLLAPKTALRFFSGRTDCSQDMKPDLSDDTKFYRRRAYEALKKEALPNAHADGKTVAGYFADDFGFSARETVAIMGAHSFGKFHADTSLFKYDWTRGTTKLLNNEYYRIITLKKHLNKQTKGGWHVVGGPGRTTTNWVGELADTRWLVRSHKFTEDGAPFQWSHQYHRCPDCQWNAKKAKWKSIDLGNGGPQYFRSEHCCNECAKLPGDSSFDPKCHQWVSQDEEALATDAGLYIDFSFDNQTGRPTGCNFPTSQQVSKRGGNWQSTTPDCPLQMLESDDGRQPKKMHEIAEQYADDQNVWAEDFIASLEKMVANGAGDLHEEFSFADLTCERKGTMRCTVR